MVTNTESGAVIGLGWVEVQNERCRGAARELVVVSFFLLFFITVKRWNHFETGGTVDLNETFVALTRNKRSRVESV